MNQINPNTLANCSIGLGGIGFLIDTIKPYTRFASSSLLPPQLKIASIALLALGILAKAFIYVWNRYQSSQKVPPSPSKSQNTEPNGSAGQPASSSTPPVTVVNVSSAGSSPAAASPASASPAAATVLDSNKTQGHFRAASGSGETPADPMELENKLKRQLAKQKEADAAQSNKADTSSKLKTVMMTDQMEKAYSEEISAVLKLDNNDSLIAAVLPLENNQRVLVAIDLSSVKVGAFEKWNKSAPLLQGDARGLNVFTAPVGQKLRQDNPSSLRNVTLEVARKDGHPEKVKIRASDNTNETNPVEIAIISPGIVFIYGTAAYFLLGSEMRVTSLIDKAFGPAAASAAAEEPNPAAATASTGK